MDRIDTEAGSLAIAYGVWLILLIEYVVFHLEMALPLSAVWGIGTLLLSIFILAKHSIKITVTQE